MNLAYENVKEVDGLDISREGSEMWEAALKRYDERIDRVEVSSLMWGGTRPMFALPLPTNSLRRCSHVRYRAKLYIIRGWCPPVNAKDFV